MTVTDKQAFPERINYFDPIRYLRNTFEDSIVREWIHHDSTDEDVLTMHFVASTTVHVPHEMNVDNATDRIESAAAERLRRDILKQVLDKPIMRCRECKFFDPGTDEAHYGFYWCNHWQMWIGINVDGYCAWGERR